LRAPFKQKIGSDTPKFMMAQSMQSITSHKTAVNGGESLGELISRLEAEFFPLDVRRIAREMPRPIHRRDLVMKTTYLWRLQKIFEEIAVLIRQEGTV
jgi:hypothetical protein